MKGSQSVQQTSFLSITFICTGKQKSHVTHFVAIFTVLQWSEPVLLSPRYACIRLWAARCSFSGPHPPRWLQLSLAQRIRQCSKPCLWCRLSELQTFIEAYGQNPWIFCRVLNLTSPRQNLFFLWEPNWDDQARSLSHVLFCLIILNHTPIPICFSISHFLEIQRK